MEQNLLRPRLRNEQLMRIHRELTKAFPHLFQEWQKRFPFEVGDYVGLELTSTFQTSREYNGIRGIKMHDNFFQFCQKFWHLVTERAPHVSKETVTEALMFHIHYYEASSLNLKGPHPRDMTMEVLNAFELKDKMKDLQKKITMGKIILIHTSSGDDLYDHTYGAIWPGPILALDFSKLD